jgi:hypothetical protein
MNRLIRHQNGTMPKPSEEYSPPECIRAHYRRSQYLTVTSAAAKEAWSTSENSLSHFAIAEAARLPALKETGTSKDWHRGALRNI